jgi:arylsulfatase A-like enzyme
MRWWRVALVVALLLGVMPAIGTETSTRAAEPPDIIVLMTDDMRADDWRVLPETERLIGGTWYPNFIYTTPLCCPFRATFHSGLYAHNHGVRRNNKGWDHFRGLEGDTVATALDEAGYHTAYVGKYMNSFSGPPPPGWDKWQALNGFPSYNLRAGYSTDVFRDSAIELIRTAPVDAPLFLMVSFYAPHEPWQPAPRHRNAEVGQTINAADRERKRTLLAVDEAVVAIAGELGSRWDNACVFFFTDNGYLLGEHGSHGKGIWFDEATRVPMRARCDGLGSGTDNRLAASIDLAPTLLRAAGTSLRRAYDGRALQDAWDRDGILIEGWNEKQKGEKRRPFTGIKGKDWVFVVPKKSGASFYLGRPEGKNAIGTLAKSERAMYASWLQALKTCRGDSCQAAERAPTTEGKDRSAKGKKRHGHRKHGRGQRPRRR